MSPEQIDGGDVDRRSDIFAIGAVMYELLSYCEAFSGATTREIEDKVMQSEPPPLASFFIPGLTPEIEAIVAKSLAKDPAERFQDAFEMERALERQRWQLGPAEQTAPTARMTPVPAAAASRKRESAAEVAFLRAQQCFEQDALEAAKRFALEALAEDPYHAKARALLEEIDPKAWTATPPDQAATSEAPVRSSAQIPTPAPPPPAAPPERISARQEIKTNAFDPTSTVLSGSTAVGGGPAYDAPVPESTFIVNAPRAAFEQPASDATFVAPLPPFIKPVPDATAARPFAEPLSDATFVSPPPAYEPPVEKTYVSPLPSSYDAPVPEGTAFSVRTSQAPMASEEMTVLGAPPDWDPEPASPPAAYFPAETPRPQPARPAPARPAPPARPAAPASARGQGPSRTPAAQPAPAPAKKSAAAAPMRQGLDLSFLRKPQVKIGLAAAAMLVLVVAITALVVKWLLAPPTGEFQLTIERPEGGTITGDGIECGSGGADCTARFDAGTPLEFQVTADAGYRFAGYTGDCSRTNGRVVMNAARICGAAFARDASARGGPDTGPGNGGSGAVSGGTPGPGGVAGARVLLQLVPPSGGTIVGPGINCGTGGKDCSREFDPGTPIRLQGWADKAFVFRGFTGDCAQVQVGDEFQITAPKTCGATFTSDTIAAAPQGGTPAGGTTTVRPGPLGPRPSGGSGSSPSGGSAGPVAGGAGAGAGGGAAGGAAGGGESPGATPAPTVEKEKPYEPPPPPPAPPPEQIARDAIKAALEKYRVAYEEKDYSGIRVVYPTAPTVFQTQFRQYAKIEYTYGGEPKFVNLDVRGGAAIVEVPTTFAGTRPVGGADKRGGVTRFSFLKRGADDEWVIVNTLVK
jgi:hypothetical protein